MEKTAIIKARDLEPAAQEWLKSILDTDLNEGDEFTVTLRRDMTVPTPEQRAAARQHLLHALLTLDGKTKHASDEEMEEDIAEAFRQIRAGRQ